MKLMNHLVLASIAVTVMTTSTAFAKKMDSKIVGGVEASIGEFPYIVSLQSSSHFCAGSLIKKNWVLTAAHCVRGGTVKKIVIGLHDQRNATNAEVILPKRIIAHPDYNSRTMDYDYALIELKEDSVHTPIAINAADFEIPDSEADAIMSTTAGWGATKESSYSLPPLLQKVDVPLVSNKECNVSYKNEITDRMICAGYPQGGKDACQGDSGGPLVAQSESGETYLVGVVSWGQGCARPKYYGVYSKVSAVADWINETAQ